eukprot:Gregarina_sp_Pseudo_9__5433@NODE_676_length_2386_cov_143_790371_g639_i0_p2_GENE_NODE_676_length_2386_cov_143_790371_g639_i0NODE_676_length_2386_cov_143_790371_g639_i0_p2_ORF_typecomplete_len264_score40_62Thg1/PF04446_12/7_1e50Thg1C/PF14413_6/1_7e34_NODE_676_length_2386_cov_143_790371_g639_i015652356
MACSKYEYVKEFEQDDKLLPGCWIVCRLDGRGFTKFANAHNFKKPNDDRALWVMTQAALDTMEELSDIVLAYGQSDEYSFVMRPNTALYTRRASKILSTVVSMFTGFYLQHWQEIKDLTPMSKPAIFDGRLVLYPSAAHMRDYLSWRQADCHINNLYNYCFWKLVESGETKRDVYNKLKDTNSALKNEILFSQFHINYNTLPLLHRKGTTLYRCSDTELASLPQTSFEAFSGDPPSIFNKTVVFHDDIIRDAFWEANPQLLAA